jgi:hypothetical protein
MSDVDEIYKESLGFLSQAFSAISSTMIFSNENRREKIKEITHPISSLGILGQSRVV